MNEYLMIKETVKTKQCGAQPELSSAVLQGTLTAFTPHVKLNDVLSL